MMYKMRKLDVAQSMKCRIKLNRFAFMDRTHLVEYMSIEIRNKRLNVM